MPLSLLHRRRRLGHPPDPPRAPLSFYYPTFSSNPVANPNLASDSDDEDGPQPDSALSGSEFGSSPTVSWLTVSRSNSPSMPYSSVASSSDDGAPFIDLFPTDVWSINRRAAILGRRRYIALPTTRANNTVAARASQVHAVVTQGVLPQYRDQQHPPRIIIVWANAARTTRSRAIMRSLFTDAALEDTYPADLDPSPAWLNPSSSSSGGNGNQPAAPYILNCSPAALLRSTAPILPLTPTILFAELPIPDDPADEGTDDDGDDNRSLPRLQGYQNRRSRRTFTPVAGHDNTTDPRCPFAAASARLWHAVAGFAGSAGDERSRVYTLMDAVSGTVAAAAMNCAVARRMRAAMRLEGVEVPALVARWAGVGVVDPVEEMAASGDGSDGGEDGEDDGGVRLEDWDECA